MRVLIVNAQAPFIRGGAEILAESLESQLLERGHQAEIVRIPFKWYPADQIPRHILACRRFNIDAGGDPPDLVIGMKFPAYLVPFRRKKLWLAHQFRQAYELWGTPYQDLPDTPEGRRVRDMVVRADTRHLPEMAEIYTISGTVADRLKTYNGVQATGVLMPPLARPELFGPGPSGNYAFYPSRLVHGKRQALAIQAMCHVRSAFTLVLAGKPDSDADGQGLRDLVGRLGLEGRVSMLGWVSEEEKARLMAGAFAALNVPFDEDYGYVTLEAFASHKAVITCRDSGGPTELVEDGYSGLVVEPTPEALAEGMEALWAGRDRTRKMGENAAESLRHRGITWDTVIEKLLG